MKTHFLITHVANILSLTDLPGIGIVSAILLVIEVKVFHILRNEKNKTIIPHILVAA